MRQSIAGKIGVVMKIASGSSNPQLAQAIADELNVPLLKIDRTKFANGELRIHIKEDVRGENVALIQSFSSPTEENIMEFLLMVDALERMGARHVSLVMPWMGYSLQDKVFRAGEPIAAKVVANLVSNTYTKRVYLLDLHNTSTPGFFAIPSHHLTAQNLFAEYVQDKIGIKNTVVVSPDFGGLKRARVFADQLGLDLVNIDKTRDLKTGDVKAIDVHGDVSGKNAIILDDIILSGATAIESASILKANGAKAIHFLSTHGIFTGDAIEKIQASELDSIVITNSVAHKSLPDKYTVLNCAEIFSDAMKHWL